MPKVWKNIKLLRKIIDMFNFNLKKSAIFPALIWEKRLKIFLVSFTRRIFLFTFIASSILFIFFLYKNSASDKNLSFLLGLSFASLGIFIFSFEVDIFFKYKISKPQIKASLETAVLKPGKINFADFLSIGAARAFEEAQGSSIKLFNNLICKNRQLNFVFSRALLDARPIKTALKERMKSGLGNEGSEIFSKTVEESFNLAVKNNHQRLTPGDVLSALAKNEPVFNEILIQSDLKQEDIANLAWWLESLEGRITKSKRFWDWDNLMKKSSIGRDWSSGYTLTLDQFSNDWSVISSGSDSEEFSGSEDQINRMERILSQDGIHNVLLVGEPGTGRKGMVQFLANKIVSGKSMPEINYKRVVVLDIVSILSRYQSNEEVEEVLETIFSEAVSSKNVILVIDEFYSFVSQPSGKIGAIDISAILSRYLPYPDFKLIGITSYAGQHLFIEKNPSILNFMEVVEVPEMSEAETMRILENKVLGLEFKYKKFVSYLALRDIIKYSSRYIKDVPFPKKAIDLLNEVVFYVSRYTKSGVILPEHVSKIVSKKTDIPVGALEQNEKDILLNLENLIHQRIINQEEAVSEVSAALRRARADITVRKGPMGCFLFLGPTGVGKTETSKALAEVYFGSEDKMIRLDMSEFQSIVDIPRLLGTTDQEGLLTTAVRENQFSLVLLDEIEKAHPNILNLFLQVLDEGFITDGLGRKTDFKNTIIIATSNAGYQIILEALKDGKPTPEIKNRLFDFLYKEQIFRPEFLNRFDATVIFKSLTKEHLLKIAELLLAKLKKNLKEKEIEFIITDELKDKIVQLGYDPVFGARQMRRVIQDKIENILAVSLLSGEIKRGDKVKINPDNFSLKKQ
jgi:ATP-dependent Clp protease ATP-binding subunit ClpC